MTNYYIIGFNRSGSNSLSKYLKSKGNNVYLDEMAFYEKTPELLNSSDKQLCIIIRDPIERAYSHYNYKKYYQEGDYHQIKCSFEEALIKHPEIINFSQPNKYIHNYNNLTIFRLEELMKIPDFPKVNIVKTYIEPLTDSRREMIRKLL